MVFYSRLVFIEIFIVKISYDESFLPEEALYKVQLP